MPLAKRIKLSEDHEEEKKSKDDNRSPTQNVSLTSKESDDNIVCSTEKEHDEGATSSFEDKISLSPPEKEISKGAQSESLGEAVSGVKVKDDSMKQVRIGKRLSVKPNRLVDDDNLFYFYPPKRPRITLKENKLQKTTSLSKMVATKALKSAASTLATVSSKANKLQRKPSLSKIAAAKALKSAASTSAALSPEKSINLKRTTSLSVMEEKKVLKGAASTSALVSPKASKMQKTTSLSAISTTEVLEDAASISATVLFPKVSKLQKKPSLSTIEAVEVLQGAVSTPATVLSPKASKMKKTTSLLTMSNSEVLEDAVSTSAAVLSPKASKLQKKSSLSTKEATKALKDTASSSTTVLSPKTSKPKKKPSLSTIEVTKASKGAAFTSETVLSPKTSKMKKTTSLITMATTEGMEDAALTSATVLSPKASKLNKKPSLTTMAATKVLKGAASTSATVLSPKTNKQKRKTSISTMEATNTLEGATSAPATVLSSKTTKLQKKPSLSTMEASKALESAISSPATILSPKASKLQKKPSLSTMEATKALKDAASASETVLSPKTNKQKRKPSISTMEITNTLEGATFTPATVLLPKTTKLQKKTPLSTMEASKALESAISSPATILSPKASKLQKKPSLSTMDATKALKDAASISKTVLSPKTNKQKRKISIAEATNALEGDTSIPATVLSQKTSKQKRKPLLSTIEATKTLEGDTSTLTTVLSPKTNKLQRKPSLSTKEARKALKASTSTTVLSPKASKLQKKPSLSMVEAIETLKCVASTATVLSPKASKLKKKPSLSTTETIKELKGPASTSATLSPKVAKLKRASSLTTMTSTKALKGVKLDSARVSPKASKLQKTTSLTTLASTKESKGNAPKARRPRKTISLTTVTTRKALKGPVTTSATVLRKASKRLRKKPSLTSMAAAKALKTAWSTSSTVLLTKAAKELKGAASISATVLSTKAHKLQRKTPVSAPTATEAAEPPLNAQLISAMTVSKDIKKLGKKMHDLGQVFFSFIGEFGNNFKEISKRMPDVGVVRLKNFYSRCQSKLSKCLERNWEPKTEAEVVYGLVNYGELLKYIRETDPLFPKCLKDLILKGETVYEKWSFNFKRKRYTKIKTPECPYFKVINKVEEACKLPSHVTVELTPKNSSAWSRVQELSQNPRVRFKLTTNRTLECIFKCLNDKWKSHRLRLKESLGGKAEVRNDELIFYLPKSSKAACFTIKPVGSMDGDELRKYMRKVFPNLQTDSNEDDTKGEDKEVTSGSNEDDKEASMKDTDVSIEEPKELPKEKDDDVLKVKSPETTIVTDGSKVDVVKDVVVAEHESAADVLKCESTEESTSEEVSSTEDSVLTASKPCDEKQMTDSVFTGTKPCNKKKMTTEFTNDQFLDFTPDGNLVVASSIYRTPPALSIPSSSSSTSSSSSLSTCTTTQSKPESQFSPSVSKNGSFSLLSSKLTPPPTTTTTTTMSSNSTSPTISPSSSTISSPLRSLTKALNLQPVSSSSSSSSSSATSKSTSSRSLLPQLLSPSVNEKMITSKNKSDFSDDNNKDFTAENLDSNGQTNSNSNTATANKKLGSGELDEDTVLLRKEVEKEIERLHTLAKSGIVLSNSNTMTLLHLSLLQERAEVIHLQYEWVEKQRTCCEHPTPAFCTPSNRMANTLRRLGHIAALELASFRMDRCKVVTKAETTEAPSKKLLGRGKKTRAIGTMTDSIIVTPQQYIPVPPAVGNSLLYPHKPNQKMDSPQIVQMNGAQPVFRVPQAPTLRPVSVMTKEQEEKLKLQVKALKEKEDERRKLLEKKEKQATALIQEYSLPKSGRLLKPRRVPRQKKVVERSIPTQRPILPKVSNEQTNTYIQPSAIQGLGPLVIPVSHLPVSGATSLIQATSAAAGPPSFVVSDSTATTPNNTPSWVTMGQQRSLLSGTNILELAVQTADIRPSPVKNNSSQDLCGSDTSFLSSLSISPSSSMAQPTFSLTSIEDTSLSIADQSNISISDLDLSLTSVSNMGPDAGDKFLDSVLERSQPGFAGLITPRVGVGLVASESSENSTTLRPPGPPVISLDSSLSAFDLSGIKTPPHSSPTNNSSSPPDKDKVGASNNADQSWMAGEAADVSLSSILGEFSSFQDNNLKLKTPTKNSVMFDMSMSSSGDVGNPVSVSIPKPSFASDVSLNALLGDPAMISPVIKVDNHHHQHQHQSDSTGGLTPLVAPHPGLFSDVSQDSLAKLDVDITLQGMVNDSSVDLVSKFEKLAAQMAEQRQEQEVIVKSQTVEGKQTGSDRVKDNS